MVLNTFYLKLPFQRYEFSKIHKYPAIFKKNRKRKEDFSHQQRATPSDKGIDNRARYLSTPEAYKARPKYSHSRNMSSYRIPML
jgi:hypothetical protein